MCVCVFVGREYWGDRKVIGKLEAAFLPLNRIWKFSTVRPNPGISAHMSLGSIFQMQDVILGSIPSSFFEEGPEKECHWNAWHKDCDLPEGEISAEPPCKSSCVTRLDGAPMLTFLA